MHPQEAVSFRPSRQQPGTLRVRTKPEGALLDAPSSPRDVQGSKLVQRMTESDAALMLGGDLLVTIFEVSFLEEGSPSLRCDFLKRGKKGRCCPHAGRQPAAYHL